MVSRCSLAWAGNYSAPAACARGSAFCLASRSSPVAWSTTFIDSRTLPRSSKPEQLDLHLVAFLDDVGGLLHAVRRELA